MSEYVTDTHAFIWHLTNDPRLSGAGKRAFIEADLGRVIIWVPSIVLVETIYLIEKKKFPPPIITQMLALLDPPTRNYRVAPLDVALIRTLQKIDRNTVPDMPDRIVAATAQQLGLPLITKDLAIASVPGLAVTW